MYGQNQFQSPQMLPEIVENAVTIAQLLEQFSIGKDEIMILNQGQVVEKTSTDLYLNSRSIWQT